MKISSKNFPFKSSKVIKLILKVDPVCYVFYV